MPQRFRAPPLRDRRSWAHLNALHRGNDYVWIATLVYFSLCRHRVGCISHKTNGDAWCPRLDHLAQSGNRFLGILLVGLETTRWMARQSKETRRASLNLPYAEEKSSDCLSEAKKPAHEERTNRRGQKRTWGQILAYSLEERRQSRITRWSLEICCAGRRAGDDRGTENQCHVALSGSATALPSAFAKAAVGQAGPKSPDCRGARRGCRIGVPS